MSEQVNLHDCEKTVFSDWGEEVAYLERVTIPDQAEARKTITLESAMREDEVDPEPIHMRWESPEPGDTWTDPDGFEYDGGWSVCSADHPDAVPFWRDSP